VSYVKSLLTAYLLLILGSFERDASVVIQAMVRQTLSV
jgi:hypothetical protein